MDEQRVPTLYEWIGGSETIERLFTLFYQMVATDDLLGPIFAKLSPEHVKHVTAFVAEVFGGPQTYSEHYGGHQAMVRRHVGRALTEKQRQRWMRLLLDCADEIGISHELVVAIQRDVEQRGAVRVELVWKDSPAGVFSFMNPLVK